MDPNSWSFVRLYFAVVDYYVAYLFDRSKPVSVILGILSILIDYSIMEKANNVYVQLCDFGWADIGTWGSLYDASPKDGNRNVIVNSNTLLYNCKENIILMPEDKLAVIQDLEGYLVVERGNALLICKKDDQNAIRKFVNDVEMKFGEKYS